MYWQEGVLHANGKPTEMKSNCSVILEPHLNRSINLTFINIINNQLNYIWNCTEFLPQPTIYISPEKPSNRMCQKLMVTIDNDHVFQFHDNITIVYIKHNAINIKILYKGKSIMVLYYI